MRGVVCGFGLLLMLRRGEGELIEIERFFGEGGGCIGKRWTHYVNDWDDL